MKKSLYEAKLLKIKEKALKREQKLKDRIKKIKRPKAPSRRDLGKRLWKLTSLYVRNVEKCCYTCNKILTFKEREAGHFWTQGGHKRVKFDLMNVHTQCKGCNHFKSGNLAPYASRLIKEYGLKKYQNLELRSNDATPFTEIELEKMILEMEEKIKALIL